MGIQRKFLKAAIMLFFSMYTVASIAATDVFYYDLTTGRSTFDSRIINLGGSVGTDKLSGLANNVDTWVRPNFTITASSNRSVSATFGGSVAIPNDGQGINMTAATYNGTPGSQSSSGLTFTFNAPINAFAVELEDWATCCHPTKLYISFDGGEAILVGSADSTGDNPGYDDGQTTFIGAIDDSGTFTQVTFWGEAAGGDVLYGGGIIRWALLPIGSLSGISVYDSSVALGNTPAYEAAQVIDDNTDLRLLFIDAGLTGDQEISNAASQTLPLLVAGSTIPTFNALSGVNRVIQARLAGNSGMSSGDDFYGDRHFWVKPFGSWMDQDDRDNVAGFDAETLGVVFGVDAAFTDSIRAGLAVAYANSDVDSNSSVAPSDMNIRTYQLIGYASKTLDENTELNFQADLGVNKNDGNRTIAFTNTVAESEYESYSFHLGTGVSHAYQINENDRVYASVRADYTRIKDKSYTEEGAGILNLSVDDRNAEEFIIGVDGKLVHKIDDNSNLRFNVGLGYDLINERASVTSVYAGAPGSSFVTHGLKPSPWIGKAGIGYVYKTEDETEITLSFDTEFRDDFLNRTASVKARWSF